MNPIRIAIALLFSVVACRSHVVADDMARAASAFLDSLSPEQRAKATFEFKGDERGNWHFIPKPRNGLTIKEMKPAQRNLALSLLHSGLSDHGFGKATNIMSLELILKQMESGRGTIIRDPEVYYFSVFGKPEPAGTWGWRVEGHHLSANFTIVKGELLSGTPSFFGSNPAEVRQGARKGLRVLAEEEDLARALLKMLDADQRKAAIIEATAPRDILTVNKRKVTPLETVGVPAAKLTRAQTEQLQALVKAYVNRVRPEMAEADLKRIDQAGWDKLSFAWAGGAEKGQPHYYRVQGPTFLLEYDNTQNDANHIHSVWRDFDNDFGEDLLRRHYSETPHGK